jgi:hypothetical protein
MLINIMDSNSTDQIIIPHSRKKILLLFLVSVGFVALGIYLLLISESWNYLPLLPILIKAVGIASIAFCGLCAIFYARMLLNIPPSLVLDSTGMVCNAIGYPTCKISWRDITRIRKTRVLFYNYVTLDLLEPEKYVKSGSIFWRILGAINLRGYGSPILVTSGFFQIEFDELRDIITEYHTKYSETTPTGCV